MNDKNDASQMPPASTAKIFAPLRRLPWKGAGLAGLGGAAAIILLTALTGLTELSLLIPPFGASCVLMFALPASPLAQPRNVVGGHLVSAAAGLIALATLGPSVVTAGVGVGLAIAAMILTKTVHPPAGANPIVVVITAASWKFLLAPVLIGSVTLVCCAFIYHRVVTGQHYPIST